VGKAEISAEEFPISSKDASKTAPICGSYFNYIMWANIFKSSIKYFIIGFNYLLKTGTIMAVTWVGYDTLSKEMVRVTIVTFLCYFFNTAFIIMLVTADCSE